MSEGTSDGALPTGWTWAKVDEVGDVQLGRQRAPDHHDGPHMRPYLRVANVFEDRIDTRDVLEMNFSPSEFETFRLRSGDVLVNEGQSLELVGRAAVFRDELPGVCFQNTLVRFRPRSCVTSEFALAVFRAYLHTGVFRAIAKRTTSIAHLGVGRFATLRFPLPPLAEQHRIVAKLEEHLTRIDAGVAALKDAKARLRRYTTAVLKAAVEGRLVPAGEDTAGGAAVLEHLLAERRRRFDESGARGPYREPVAPETRGLPALPSNWCWASVDMVGDVLLGRRRAPEYVGAPRRYLRVANVKDSRLKLDDVLTMPFDDRECERYRLAPGDILVSEGQSPELVGQSAIYRGELPDLCFQATLHRFRPVPGGPSSEFAQIVFRAFVRAGVFMRIASITTNIAHLTLERFKAAPFPLPPLAEQERIVAEVERRLSRADALAAAVDTNLRRAERLRRALLKRAVEGRLVPQDPRDEPADALLARVRAATPPRTRRAGARMAEGGTR